MAASIRRRPADPELTAMVTLRWVKARDELTDRIIGGAVAVHRTPGPGLLEQAYMQCIAWELTQRCLTVEREVTLPVAYGAVRIEFGYRIDLLVERAVIVEVKAVERLHPVHHAQLLTYLRLTGLTRGLLLNFWAPTMKDGVHRFVLNYQG